MPKKINSQNHYQIALHNDNGTTFVGASCSASQSVSFCCMFIQLSADVPVAILILKAMSGLKEDFSLINSERAFLLMPSNCAVLVTERLKRKTDLFLVPYCLFIAFAKSQNNRK